jgi:WD40 repeat protein
VYGIAFDPSGQRLAVMIGGEVQLWDLTQRARTNSLARPVDGVVMDWHPDGRHLATGFENGELWLWDTQTGEARQLPGHTQYVSCVAFDPLGELLVSDSWDSQTRFWDAALGRLLFSHRLDLDCQFSRDGHWLGIHREAGGLERARVVHSAVFRQLTSPNLKWPHLTGVDLSTEGRWLAVGDRAGWVLCDLVQSRQVASVPDCCGGRLKFHPDGRSVITFTPDQVLQWPLEIASDSNVLRVGAAKVLVSAPGSGFQCVSLSADGALLAVAGVNRSLLVDLDKLGRQVGFAPGHVVSQAALFPDKRWVAVAAVDGSGVTLWNALTGQFHRQLTTNEWVCIALSPDGRTLASATVRECCWWDTGTWQVRQRFPLDQPGGVPGNVAISPDGRLLALAADRQKLILFDLRTGDELATLTAPAPQIVEALAFSGDGGLLAAGTTAGVVQFWDLRELRRELAALGLDW